MAAIEYKKSSLKKILLKMAFNAFGQSFVLPTHFLMCKKKCHKYFSKGIRVITRILQAMLVFVCVFYVTFLNVSL